MQRPSTTANRFRPYVLASHLRCGRSRLSSGLLTSAALGAALLLSSIHVIERGLLDRALAIVVGLIYLGFAVIVLRKAGIVSASQPADDGEHESLGRAISSGALSGGAGGALGHWALKRIPSRYLALAIALFAAAVGGAVLIGAFLSNPITLLSAGWTTTKAAIELIGFGWLVLTSLFYLAIALKRHDKESVARAVSPLLWTMVLLPIGYVLGLLDPWIQMAQWIAEQLG